MTRIPEGLRGPMPVVLMKDAIETLTHHYRGCGYRFVETEAGRVTEMRRSDGSVALTIVSAINLGLSSAVPQPVGAATGQPGVSN